MIVVVIMGLLLGSILKGEEMITSARVHNLISQQDGIKAAYYGFVDRYRALPGDYAAATANIPGISANAACGNGNGDGNGRIEVTGNEHLLVWEHLSKAGFVRGEYSCSAPPLSTLSTPVNASAVFIELVWDANFDDPAGPATTARHNLKTGSQIASNLLGEVDRKIDDGSATGGGFRFSAYNGGAGAPVGSGRCYQADQQNTWATASPYNNCGAASLL